MAMFRPVPRPRAFALARACPARARPAGVDAAAAARLTCAATALSRLSLVNGLVRYWSDPTIRPRARSNRPSFDDSMITGVSLELGVLLDQRAGLVAVEARHHDVDEDEVRLVIGDLGQRVEAVLGQDDRAARLQQEDFGAAANGVRIVDHHHLDALQRICSANSTPLCCLPTAAARGNRAPHLSCSSLPRRQANCLEHKACRNRHWRPKTAQNATLRQVFAAAGACAARQRLPQGRDCCRSARAATSRQRPRNIR